MQIEQISALTLVAVIAANILLSGVVLLWGRKLPRQGDWLIGTGLLGAVLAVVLSWSSLGEWQFGPARVLRGWVLGHRDPKSLGVGILEDPLSYAMTILFAAVASAMLLGRSLGKSS